MTQFLIRFFIKDAENIHDHRVRESYGILGSVVGIILNIILFVMKFLAGLVTASIAITADAFNNLSDAASSVVTLIGFKMARAPAHKEHPFGHGRIEYIAGLIVAMMIILVGVELAKSSIDKILHPEAVTFSLLSLGILLVSVLVKFWMAAFNKGLGKTINSPAMQATAVDSLSDAIATTAVIVGLVITYYTNWQIDGYIGILVAAFILYAGYSTAKDTLSPLLGQAPDRAFVDEVKETVLAHDDIIGIHDMIIHNYGPGRSMLSLHAEVSSGVDIIKIHDTIDIIEQQLKQKYQCDAVIHMDPILIDDTESILTREKIAILVKQFDPECTIHDFRMTKGPTHRNLIFDLVVPHELAIEDKELLERVSQAVKELDSTYYAVIQLDKTFV